MAYNTIRSLNCKVFSLVSSISNSRSFVALGIFSSKFCIAIVVACLPCAAFCIFQTAQNHIMGNLAAFLSGGTKHDSPEINMLTAYLMLWALLAFCAVVFTLLYIPHHLEKQRVSLAIQVGEANIIKKAINLKQN